MAMCPAPRWPVVIEADEGVGSKIDLDDLPAGRGALIKIVVTGRSRPPPCAQMRESSVGRGLVQIPDHDAPERLGLGIGARQVAHLDDGFDLFSKEPTQRSSSISAARTASKTARLF
jgi:hypothetical protein